MSSCLLAWAVFSFTTHCVLIARVAPETVGRHALASFYNTLAETPWSHKGAEVPTEAEVRDWVSEKVESLNESGMHNPFTDEPFREENSPGNYQMIRKGDELRMYVCDANGALVTDPQSRFVLGIYLPSMRIRSDTPSAP